MNWDAETFAVILGQIGQDMANERLPPLHPSQVGGRRLVEERQPGDGIEQVSVLARGAAQVLRPERQAQLVGGAGIENGNVELSVGVQPPTVEVRRADAPPRIINDGDLPMRIDWPVPNAASGC